MFGKWHLGYCSKKYTPYGRGFDSFEGRFLAVAKGTPFGLYTEKVERKKRVSKFVLKKDKQKRQLRRRKERQDRRLQVKFNKKKRKYFGIGGRRIGRSLQRPKEMVADSYTKQVYKLLQKTKRESNPLFVYLSFFTKTYNKFSESEIRRDRTRIIKSMDDTVKDIMTKLAQTSQDKNTIVAFISDNGAREMPTGVKSSNYPLRGYKGSVYEGGTKVPAFIYSAGIEKHRYNSRNYYKLLTINDVILTCTIVYKI